MCALLPLTLLACGASEPVDTATPGNDPTTVYPRICINELMPDNEGSLDVEGAHPDWVELHNPTDDPVPLDGWCLSETQTCRVFLDGLTLEPRGFLVLLADGEDGDLNLPFSLDADGQGLSLIDPSDNGQRVEWSHIRSDRSAALQTDCCEGDCWGIAEPATPGTSND